MAPVDQRGLEHELEQRPREQRLDLGAGRPARRRPCGNARAAGGNFHLGIHDGAGF
jgi:hypothetical protein